MVGMLLFRGGKVWGGFGWVMWGQFCIFVHKLLILKATMGIFQELLMAVEEKNVT